MHPGWVSRNDEYGANMDATVVVAGMGFVTALLTHGLRLAYNIGRRETGGSLTPGCGSTAIVLTACSNTHALLTTEPSQSSSGGQKRNATRYVKKLTDATHERAPRLGRFTFSLATAALRIGSRRFVMTSEASTALGPSPISRRFRAMSTCISTRLSRQLAATCPRRRDRVGACYVAERRARIKSRTGQAWRAPATCRDLEGGRDRHCPSSPMPAAPIRGRCAPPARLPGREAVQ